MNPLFNMMNPQPQNGMMQMMQRFQQFNLLNSGRVSQAQYDQAVQMAQQFQKMLSGK